jgi:benzoate-CoA ligase family protein
MAARPDVPYNPCMVSPQNNLAVRLLDGALERGLGSKVALREGDRGWTYDQLHDQVRRVSAALRTLRVQRGERVAILMRDSLEAAASILGTIHAGAIAVPLSELARAGDIGTYLEHSGAVLAIVDGHLEPMVDQVRAQVPSLREVLCLGNRSAGERDFYAVVRSAAAAPSATAVNRDDVCLLLYSSGTATPEVHGVPHRHGAPIAAWEATGASFLGLGETDRVLSVIRLTTAYGLATALFFPLAAGAESVLLPEQPRSDALFAAVARYRPTVFCATPSVFGQLARDARTAGLHRPLSGLRASVSAGESMPDKLVPRVLDALGTCVAIGYGLSELFQFGLGTITGPGWTGRTGTCGTPMPGVEVRVVDDDGHPVPPDEIGTLQLRGPALFTGYWPAPAPGSGSEPAAEAFTADGWFTTRDRFLVDTAGIYHHCGRLDDQFKVGGKWVSPVEVERALSAHEAVWECAVIGADDEDGLVKPLAFVVPNVGHDPGPPLEAELRAYVKEVLAPYKYPRWIEFVDQLPRGPGGKLLRYKLRPGRRRRRAETAAEP